MQRFFVSRGLWMHKHLEVGWSASCPGARDLEIWYFVLASFTISYMYTVLVDDGHLVCSSNTFSLCVSPHSSTSPRLAGAARCGAGHPGRAGGFAAQHHAAGDHLPPEELRVGSLEHVPREAPAGDEQAHARAAGAAQPAVFQGRGGKGR